jgi:hypothetical protein
LPERVTIAENQTKQVGFLDLHDVPASKPYSFEMGYFSSNDRPEHVDTILKFSNVAAALPAGVVRVYIRDQDGDAKFIGEDHVDHTPAGSDLELKTGQAFDVTVQPTVVSSDKLSATRTRYVMSYVIRNAKNEAATVQVRQGGLGRNGKVEHESQASQRVDADTLQWSVKAPAHGETTLTATIDTGD